MRQSEIRSATLACIGMLLFGCGVNLSPGAETDASVADNIDARDRAADANTMDAMLGAWMGMTPIAPAALANVGEDDASMSPNELEIVFAIAGTNVKTLHQAKRATRGSAWGTPQPLLAAIAGVTDQTPRYAGDGLTLYFGSTRAGATGPLGNENVWKIKRDNLTSAWGTPTPVAEVNSLSAERWFAPCDDGRYLLISDRKTAGDLDVYEGKLGAGAPTHLALFSSTAAETGTFLSANCKHAFFTTRNASFDIMQAERNGASWTTPVPVTEVNTATINEQDPWLSADGHTLVFVSDVAGTNDVYQMTRM
jgi:hypothetical protein